MTCSSDSTRLNPACEPGGPGSNGSYPYLSVPATFLQPPQFSSDRPGCFNVNATYRPRKPPWTKGTKRWPWKHGWYRSRFLTVTAVSVGVRIDNT